MKRTPSVGVSVLLVLVVAGGLVLTQCSTGTQNPVDGPGMLYFYAVW